VSSSPPASPPPLTKQQQQQQRWRQQEQQEQQEQLEAQLLDEQEADQDLEGEAAGTVSGQGQARAPDNLSVGGQVATERGSSQQCMAAAPAAAAAGAGV